MIRLHRLAVIYRKELLDILRDRRTLIAMIIIPVVLYPLLMLWLVWESASAQARLRHETFIIEVSDEPTRRGLEGILQEAENRLAASQSPAAESQMPTTAPSQSDRPRLEIRVGQTPDTQIGSAVQLRVALTRTRQRAPLPERLEVRIDYNETDIRSRAALDDLTGLLNDFRQMVTRESVRQILGERLFSGQPPPNVLAADNDINLILNPIEITTTSIASQKQRGGWALGQIIPILLVLMIFSGAIYPAVDLTAGERERGTLETLMATPVPTLHLIIGKFLVVATIAMLIAALNLASAAATMHFGGITRAMSAQMPVELPLAVLPLILLCMVPLSLLFAALLVAVCSFARTFKEAQNYVVPVIIATLVACVPVAVESARLEGLMLVLPVSNMILLTRDLLQQNATWSAAVVVLLSTTLYAAAAIAVAARLFGQEAVMFVDTGSYKTLLRRRLFKPMPRPTASIALLLVALLFPACFYGQAGLMGQPADRFVPALKWLAVWQFAGLFVVLPAALGLYFKVDLGETFRLRLPPWPAWPAAVLLGLSTWALALQFVRWQHHFLPPSEAVMKAAQQLEVQLSAAPIWLVLLLLAAVPAVSEEMLFRGFLLSGLSMSLRKWPAILAAAGVFATFHFMVDRIPLTFLLGTLLAYVCWQTRSLLPGIAVHVMHNAAMLLTTRLPALRDWLHLTESDDTLRLPPAVLLAAGALFLIALLTLRTARPDSDHSA